MRGAHESNLSEKYIAHFDAESKAKVSAKQLLLVPYDLIKEKLPEQMKVSPISAIPHKSKAFQSILDLDFSLQLIPQGRVPSDNEIVKRQLQEEQLTKSVMFSCNPFVLSLRPHMRPRSFKKNGT